MSAIAQGSATVRTFLYDAAGSQTSHTRSGTAYVTAISDAGRIKQITVGGSIKANYTYDGLNRLSIRQTLNSTPSGTTHLIHDVWGHVIAETDGAGHSVREYIWLGNIPVAVIDGSSSLTNPTVLWVHVDHLSRPEMMTDASKAVKWKAVYELFSTVSSITGTAALQVRFPRQRFQVGARLAYNDTYPDGSPSGSADSRLLEQRDIGLVLAAQPGSGWPQAFDFRFGGKMTAIVALAESDLAFVAADTKRTLSHCPASKIHAWSDRTLFGQAGNALHMTQAIMMALACQSIYGTSLAGLLEAFEQCRIAYHPKAIAHHQANPDLAAGTILIAHAGDETDPHGLWTMEFDPTVPAARLASAVSGIGVPGVADQAIQDWANRPAGTISLAQWASGVVQPFVCSTVDWPLDALVARRASVQGERLLIRQRFATPAHTPDPSFDHPQFQLRL